MYSVLAFFCVVTSFDRILCDRYVLNCLRKSKAFQFSHIMEQLYLFTGRSVSAYIGWGKYDYFS